jgi:hypothetical protein
MNGLPRVSLTGDSRILNREIQVQAFEWIGNTCVDILGVWVRRAWTSLESGRRAN